MSDEAPKSAYEIAMERLRRKDEQEGVESLPLTDEQRAALAEVRQVYEAKLAEREILHRSQLARTQDPAALETLEQEHRRERERLGSERERKLDELRRTR